MDLSQTQPLEAEKIPETAKSNPEEQVGCLRILAQKGLEAKCLPVFRDKNVIGSNKDVCHIHIPSRAVSNRHAVIDVDGQTHLLYDLYSMNHTYRGKMFLRPEVRYEIKNGDLLSFADIICQYFIDHKHGDGEHEKTRCSPQHNNNNKSNVNLESSLSIEDKVISMVETAKKIAVLETPNMKPKAKNLQNESGNDAFIERDSRPERVDIDSDTSDDLIGQSESESGMNVKSPDKSFNWANMQTQPAVLAIPDASTKEDNRTDSSFDDLAPTQLFPADYQVPDKEKCDSFDAPTQLFDHFNIAASSVSTSERYPAPSLSRQEHAKSNAGKNVVVDSSIIESDDEEDMLQDLNQKNEKARNDEICKNIENEIRSAIEDDNDIWNELETQNINSSKSRMKNCGSNDATQKIYSPSTAIEPNISSIFDTPTQLIIGEDNNVKLRKLDASSSEIRRSTRVPKKKKVWDGDDDDSSNNSTAISSSSHMAKKQTKGPETHATATKSQTRGSCDNEDANLELGEWSGMNRKKAVGKRSAVSLHEESDEEGFNDLVIDTDAQPGRRIAKLPLVKKKKTGNDSGGDGGEATKKEGPSTVESLRPKTITRTRKAKTNFPDDSEWISPKKRSLPVTPGSGSKVGQGSPKVMFTGLSDFKWTKVIKALGGETTESVFDCTILVTDKIRRTCKLLCSIARGKPIVSQKWLQECDKSHKFIDSGPFLVKDVLAEEKYGFTLNESIKKATQKPLLDGYTVHATSGVTPDPDDIKTIVECSGGQYLMRMPTSTRIKKNTIIISVLENEHIYRSLQSAGVPITGTEFLLSGVLRQKLEFKKYSLSTPVETETTQTRKARK